MLISSYSTTSPGASAIYIKIKAYLSPVKLNWGLAELGNINEEKDIKKQELNNQIEIMVQKVKTYEELKIKSEELMEIMSIQNSEIETLKTKAANDGSVNIIEILGVC